MSEWIPGPGWHYIQPTKPIDEEQIKHDMDALEAKIQAAELSIKEREGIGA